MYSRAFCTQTRWRNARIGEKGLCFGTRQRNKKQVPWHLALGSRATVIAHRLTPARGPIGRPQDMTEEWNAALAPVRRVSAERRRDCLALLHLDVADSALYRLKRFAHSRRLSLAGAVSSDHRGGYAPRASLHPVFAPKVGNVLRPAAARPFCLTQFRLVWLLLYAPLLTPWQVVSVRAFECS